MARLKAFQAHLGFFDTVVAAPSQKAALQAWGSRQNLFRDGAAKPASDPDAVAAALAKPGVVLKRLAGSKDPFSEQPPLPKKSARTKAASAEGVAGPAQKARQLQKSRRTAPRRTKPPDRSKVDAAERALAELRQERETMRADFEQREESLREQQRKREHDVQARQHELERELAAQRKLFRKALKSQ